MGRPLIERRCEPRLTGADLPPMQATLRPGYAVSIVDLSPAGAQIDTERPLRPGARVHIRFVLTGDAILAGAVVLRCAVYAIHADAGVLYRSALFFDADGVPYWRAVSIPGAAWERT